MEKQETLRNYIGRMVDLIEKKAHNTDNKIKIAYYNGMVNAYADVYTQLPIQNIEISGKAEPMVKE